MSNISRHTHSPLTTTPHTCPQPSYKHTTTKRVPRQFVNYNFVNTYFSQQTDTVDYTQAYIADTTDTADHTPHLTHRLTPCAFKEENFKRPRSQLAPNSRTRTKLPKSNQLPKRDRSRVSPRYMTHTKQPRQTTRKHITHNPADTTDDGRHSRRRQTTQ